MIRWVVGVVALLTTGCATVQSLQFEQPISILGRSESTDLASRVDHSHS